MKRWLCSLLLPVGVICLMWIAHRSVRPHLHLQTTGHRSALRQNEFVSTWCRAVQAASPAFPEIRAGPSEFFVTKFGFVITDIAEHEGPPWLDDRGPPGPNAPSHQDLVTSCEAAGQANSLKKDTCQRNSATIEGKFKASVLQHALASGSLPAALGRRIAKGVLCFLPQVPPKGLIV